MVVSILLRGRLKAAFLFALILLVTIVTAGCTAMGNALLAPFEQWLEDADASDAAARGEVPAIRFDLGDGRVGVFQLYRHANGQSFWIIGSGESVVLRDGMLESTGVSNPRLAMSVFDDRSDDQAASDRTGVEYQFIRSWANDEGVYQTGRARARLECAARQETVEVGSGERLVRRCVETARWASGKRTRSVYWRDVRSNEVLKAEVVAWPDAPKISWQVIQPMMSGS